MKILNLITPWAKGLLYFLPYNIFHLKPLKVPSQKISTGLKNWGIKVFTINRYSKEGSLQLVDLPELIIDRVFPFNQTNKAMAYVASAPQARH